MRRGIHNRIAFPLSISSTPLPLPISQKKMRFAISGNLRTVNICELNHADKYPVMRPSRCRRVYLPRETGCAQVVLTFWFLVSRAANLRCGPVLLGECTHGLWPFLSSFRLWAVVGSVFLEDAGLTRPSLLCPLPLFLAICWPSSTFVVCSVFPSSSFAAIYVTFCSFLYNSG